MKRIFKKSASVIVFLTFFFVNCYVANAAYLLFEKTKVEDISKGVTYSKINQVTSDGLRDIHVIKVPTKDPNIKIKNKSSAKDYELKETTSQLVNSEQDALGGVNGDFFVLNGSHSVAQGATVENNSLVSTDNLNNLNKNEYSTFCLTSDGSPFIDYIKTDIDFLNNGVENIKVHYMNKYPEITYPIYMDARAMSDTSPVDSVFPNVTKIIVQDNKITGISQKGETVKIPQNGYVIMISEQSIDYIKTLVKVGDKAEVKINANIDYNALETAIGGGGKLLSGGKTVADSGFYIKGRQPRTAIGINKDGNEIFLVVVDGRTHSIGATHDELASIMQRIGAYEAMHLDGGGSSTMVVKKDVQDNTNVVNTPSEGYERKIINALGVYNKSETGELKTIKIIANDKVIKGSGLKYSVIGFDDYLNKIELDQAQISVFSSDTNAKYSNSTFYPSVAGNIKLTAVYKNLSYDLNIISLNVSSLIPNIQKIKTDIGVKNEIYMSGKASNGNTVSINDSLKYELVPADLGKMENNVFTAAKNGNGYIKVTYNDIVSYIDVSVGKKSVRLSPFDDVGNFAFEGSSKDVTGNAYHAKEFVADGGVSIALKYKFPILDKTQAAYIVFKDKIQLKNDPSNIKLTVFGDNSKNWLRAKIVDSNKSEFILDLAKEIDWSGKKEVTAAIPGNVKYPIYLERIYLASLSNQSDKESVIYVDQLMGEVYYNDFLEHPASTAYWDNFNKDLTKENIPNSFDITAIGNITAAKKPANYSETQKKAVASLVNNTKKALLIGANDYPNDFGVPILKAGKNYTFYTEGNTGLVTMNANTGNLYDSNLDQWQNIDKDIKEKNKNNLIIMMDRSPLNLRQPKEFEFFHDILSQHAKNGKNIFVVSAEGAYNTVEVRDGIRYINLGALYNSSGEINNDFRVLRFRIANDNIYYDLQKVF